MLRKIFLLISAIPTLAAAQDAPPLRFRLAVGQQLSYLGTAEFHHAQGTQKIADHLTLWVTALNADGSWRVIGLDEKQFEEIPPNQKNNSRPPDKIFTFDAFDVFPDGRLARPPADARGTALTGYFFPLPADGEAAATRWQVADDGSGETMLYNAFPPADDAGGDWFIDRTSTGLLNEIYHATSRTRLQFDPELGLVTRVEAEFTQGWGRRGNGRSTAVRVSVIQRDAQWIAQLAREAEIFFAANAALRGAVTLGSAGPRLSLETAERVLREQRRLVSLPLVRAQFDRTLEQFPATVRHRTESALRERAVLRQPAIDWETADLDGQPHRSRDYRGKVVLLAFWSRGNRWSIRALSQLGEIARQCQSESVTVFSMNIDADETDARFVVEKLGLAFPTLKAGGVASLYQLRSFPALLVLDAQGVVRAQHIGSGPKLAEEVLASIEDLLHPSIAIGPPR